MSEKPDSKYSEDVRQHLSFIQGVINRMNSNSFSLKGWMVAIVSALCAIYVSNNSAPNSHLYLIAALLAVILFCGLDAYYLQMEKKYRKLFNKVLESPSETDYNMDISGEKVSYWEALKSTSVCVLYIVVAILLGLALLLGIS